MEHAGKERRRRGPVNRLRRIVYGLLLSSGVPLATLLPAGPAQAAERPAQSSPARAARSVELDLGGRALLLNASSDGEDVNVLSGELRPRSLSERGAAPFDLDPHQVLLTLQVHDTGLRSLKSGLRLNLTLAEMGQFHLTLYRGKAAQDKGKSWEIRTAEPAADGQSAPPPADRNWSLGSTLDLVRTPESGHRRVVLVPQLNVDLGKMLDAPGRLEASIQHAHWHNRAGDTTTEDALPQLRLDWRF